MTLDSPHPGFDPALPEECDPNGGRLVRESWAILSLLLLCLNSFVHFVSNQRSRWSMAGMFKFM